MRARVSPVVLAFGLAGLLPTLAARPARADEARLLKGPYLTGIGATAADVRFELGGAAAASVDVGLDGATATRTIADPAASTGAVHDVRLTGLEPGKAYAYAVRAGGAVVGKGRFVTAPPDDSPAPVTFLVYGDDRSDPSAHATVVRAVRAMPSDFLVNTGDVVEDGGSASDWQAFFDVEGPVLRERALFLAIGNHELYDDNAGANFARYFGYPDPAGTPKPYGTVRWGDVRLFFLNGMHDWSSGEERQWLERELGKADAEPALRWRIAVVHHGPWSSGPHGANGKLLDAHVPQLLLQHGVDLLLAGHDHIYERGDGDGLKYVISGGGGAPLYRVAQVVPTTRKAESSYHFVEVRASTDGVRVVAHRADGTIADTCGFAKGQPWDCDPPSASRSPGAAAGMPAAASPSPEGAPTSSQGSSRCGCSLPGAARAGSLAAVGAAIAGLALVLARRRARRRG